MLMIRLQRVGRAHDPSYRVVVTEKASGPKAGTNVEELGHYDARGEKAMGKDLTINVERTKYWISVGAQPSGAVHNLLVRENVIKGKKMDVRPAKIVIKKEEPKKEEPKAESKPAEVKEEVPAEPVAEEVVAEEPVVAAPAE